MSEVRERTAGRPDSARSALEVDLELPASSFAAVGRLVVAGMASRLGLTVDRIDELQLALDTALRRPASGGVLSLRMRPAPGELSVSLGPLSVHGSERDDLERVLSALVDDVAAHEAEGDLWVDLRISLDSLAPASS